MELKEVNPGLVWSGMERNPFKAVEEFSFGEEVTGYGNNLNRRTQSAIRRCIQHICHSDETPKLEMLPPFDPDVRVRVTLEVIAPGQVSEDRDWKSEALAWQATAENLQAKLDASPQTGGIIVSEEPGPEEVVYPSKTKFTKRFLSNDCNKEALQAICTELGLDIEGTNKELVDRILAKQE